MESNKRFSIEDIFHLVESKISLQQSFMKTNLPLIIIKAQAKHLCFLLDTGSNINVLDRRVSEFFHLSENVNCQKSFGIDGTLQTSAVIELAFSLEEREYKTDFSVMDLSPAFGKVEEETGIQIHGLLGCSFMEQQKWILDFEELCLFTP